MKKNQVTERIETIDCTPTWAWVASVCLLSLRDGNEEGKQIARDQIAEMAAILDKLNAGAAIEEAELVGKLKAENEELRHACEQMRSLLEFHEDYTFSTPPQEPKDYSQYVKAVFTIDGERPVVGIHDPNVRWNGWACPLFTKQMADIITKAHANQEMTAHYDEAKDAYVFKQLDSEEEADEYTGQDVDGVRMYAIGAFGWVWEAEKYKEFFDQDITGRGSGSTTLVHIVEDATNLEEYYNTEEEDIENTLIHWALNAEIGDSYQDDSSEYTRTK